jgi:hypothetical protein
MQGRQYQPLGQPGRTELCNDMERHSIVTYDRLIEPMIDHIEEALFVSCITRQTDLLGAALWCLGLGNIDTCEVCPFN